MTSDGKKMGKTEKGALFLDPAMVSPYDFFQYWRDVADSDVERFLLMFAFLPAAECRELAARKDAGINESQGAPRLGSRLPYPWPGRGRRRAGGGEGRLREGRRRGAPLEDLPRSEMAAGMGVLDLFVLAGLASTKSEARRLVQQGGAVVNERKVGDEKAIVDSTWLDTEGVLVLRAGKKRVFRIVCP